jgi:hypothetical protein
MQQVCGEQNVLNLRCGLAGHKINRRRVWNDGQYFRTDCDRCGRPLVRTLSGWEPFEENASDEALPTTAGPQEDRG